MRDAERIEIENDSQSRDMMVHVQHLLTPFRFMFCNVVNADVDHFLFCFALTADPNTLFRSNSLASKAMEQFMKVRYLLLFHNNMKAIFCLYPE